MGYFTLVLAFCHKVTEHTVSDEYEHRHNPFRASYAGQYVTELTPPIRRFGNLLRRMEAGYRKVATGWQGSRGRRHRPALSLGVDDVPSVPSGAPAEVLNGRLIDPAVVEQVVSFGVDGQLSSHGGTVAL